VTNDLGEDGYRLGITEVGTKMTTIVVDRTRALTSATNLRDIVISIFNAHTDIEPGEIVHAVRNL